MDMPDGTTWVDPNRPAAVVAGEPIPEPFCWCCGADQVVAVVESIDDDGSHIRIGVCCECLHNHGDEYLIVEEL